MVKGRSYSQSPGDAKMLVSLRGEFSVDSSSFKSPASGVITRLLSELSLLS